MIKNKNYFLDAHGCAKNQVDAELIISRLESCGWVAARDAKNAAIIIVNTCGFIESAKKESLDAIISARKNYPEAKIIMAGCLSERYADLFKDEFPEADAIFGNGDLSKIDVVLDELALGNRPVIVPAQEGIFEGDRTGFLGFPSSTYIKITEGCDNACSFCAIPLIRGRLRSRPIDSIVNEIRSLIERGIFEYNLIGQDLAAYGSDMLSPVHTQKIDQMPTSQSPLAQLLLKISELEGNFWVRLLYIHPDHFSRDILPIIQKDTRILPYFDIPFQSGDTDIIRAMNRTGSSHVYENIIKDIRASLPNATLRTTFLCGFPGETEEAAENTALFLQTIRPDWSGCFTYSREEGTAAADFKKHVSAKKAKERVARLQTLQETITAEKLQSHIGKTYDVLVEELIEGEKLALGRAWFQAPEVDGACVIRYDEDALQAIKPGAVVRIKIVGVRGVDVVGNYAKS